MHLKCSPINMRYFVSFNISQGVSRHIIIQ